MTEKEILESNILIDIFRNGRMLVPNMNTRTMGYRRGSSQKYWNYYDCCEVIDLKYHSSFDWLVPACKKWDTLFQGKKITNKRYSQYEDTCDLLDNRITQYEIKPVFEQLVANIKWLNKQKWYNKNLQS